MSGTRFLIRTMRLLVPLLLATNLLALTGYAAADDPEAGSLNKPERLEWFRDQGFGLFIHWSVDSQLGVVISHSLVGASPEYTDRFFEELPKTFDPHDLYPLDWARLAHLAGIRYVMFTTKHHSGFAMFDTKTTPFGIMNTPVSSRYHEGGLRRFPFPRHCRRRLLFPRRFLVASPERQDHRARGSRGPAAQQPWPDEI